MSSLSKPIHVKPSFYAFCFEQIKDYARDRGWNLVLHGSMNTDLDLILLPWHPCANMSNVTDMVRHFAEMIGGHVQLQQNSKHDKLMEYNETVFDRRWYTININRGGESDDPKYYLDISAYVPFEQTDETP